LLGSNLRKTARTPGIFNISDQEKITEMLSEKQKTQWKYSQLKQFGDKNHTLPIKMQKMKSMIINCTDWQYLQHPHSFFI